MSDDESFNFPHKVGDLIMDELVVGTTSKYDIHPDAFDKIRAALKEGLEGPDQEKVAKTITEVTVFLESQGGSEAATSLTEIVASINEPDEGEEPKKKKSLFANIPEMDEVEHSIGRSAMESIMDKKRVKVAPKVGEEKPEGAVSLQDLIGTKRRM